MKSKFSPVFLGLSVLALSLTTPAHAVLVAYWNMDASTLAGKLPPNNGTQWGTLSAGFFNSGMGSVEIDAEIPGTSLNLVGSAPLLNQAAGFYRGVSVYSDQSFRMEGFNFTGLSDVSISFAYDSDNSFTWDSNFEVDYRINNGLWIDFAESETWTPEYVIAAVDFGSVLDGQSDVDLRLRTVNWVSIAGFLDIDNVQINAVPEPAHFATIAALMVLGASILRRPRRV